MCMSGKNIIAFTVGVLIMFIVIFMLENNKNEEKEVSENYIFKISMNINFKNYKDNILKHMTIPNGKVKDKINIDNNIEQNVSNGNKELSIPVLAYHSFMKNEDKWKYAPNDKYVMEIEKFEEQLKYLHDNGYESIDIKTLLKWMNGETKISNRNFVITIDDGNISAYHLAIPIIEKYGFNATIFVITGRVRGESENYDPSRIAFFGEDIIKDIKDNHKSIYVASHSTNMHTLINGMNPKDVLKYEEIVNDLKSSKDYLNTIAFAYPFGMYDSNYVNATREAGFSIAFTFKEPNRVRKDTNKYEVPRFNINNDTTMQNFIQIFENY